MTVRGLVALHQGGGVQGMVDDAGLGATVSSSTANAVLLLLRFGETKTFPIAERDAAIAWVAS